MNMGQMLEDIQLAVNGKRPIRFFGKPSGTVPTVSEIYEKIIEVVDDIKINNLTRSIY